jgi:hypothetical protein
MWIGFPGEGVELRDGLSGPREANNVEKAIRSTRIRCEEGSPGNHHQALLAEEKIRAQGSDEAPSSKSRRGCGPRKEAREAAKKSLEGNQNTCGRRLIVRAWHSDEKNRRTDHVRNRTMGLWRLWTVSHGRLDHSRHCFRGRGCLTPTIRSLVMRAHFPTERAAAMRKVAGARRHPPISSSARRTPPQPAAV